MEITKTLKLPTAANIVDNFIRQHCEANGVWPVAMVTATSTELILTYRTRDKPNIGPSSENLPQT